MPGLPSQRPSPAPSDAGLAGAGSPPVEVLTGVFAIDDHPLFRHGLAALLAAEGGYDWLGEASSSLDALRQAAWLRPDLVFVDQLMPGLDGITLTESLKAHWPDARFLVLASRLDGPAVRRITALGASCLHKSVSPAELMVAVRAVRRGQRVLSPAVRTAIDRNARQAPLRETLTPRERALLQLMAQGLDNRSISLQLDITVPTVKFHVTNIMAKLNASNRTAAVLAALREQLIGLDTQPQAEAAAAACGAG